MRKLLVAALLLFLVAPMMFAQSLRDTEEYQNMLESRRLYEEAYETGDYDAALGHAQEMRRWAEAVDALAEGRQSEPAEPAEPEPPQGDFIAFYVVKPGEYFYKIAGYDFVYGDSEKWPVLYEANKHMLVQPDNPDLIHPDMKFKIPSIEGEQRSGTR